MELKAEAFVPREFRWLLRGGRGLMDRYIRVGFSDRPRFDKTPSSLVEMQQGVLAWRRVAREILCRESLARAATDFSTRFGPAGPSIHSRSTREELFHWLHWNDRLGIWSDSDRAEYGEEPLSLDGAWGEVARALNMSKSTH